MSLLVLALAATALGFLVLVLAGAGRRSPAAAPVAGDPPGDAAGLGWVRARGVAGLERLLVALLAELGLTVERADRGAGSVDLQATDPTPIRGGRVLVHAVLAAPGAALPAGDVRAAFDAARADGFGKALVVTLGRFSDEAREAARDQPVELVDGDALAALVRRRLPQAWATRTI